MLCLSFVRYHGTTAIGHSFDVSSPDPSLRGGGVGIDLMEKGFCPIDNPSNFNFFTEAPIRKRLRLGCCCLL